LGRDLLVQGPKDKHFAFINSFYSGLLDDEFTLFIDPEGTERLYRYRSPSPTEDVKGQFPERARKMARLCRAIHETSKYLLYHNQPSDHSAP
jgi:hypothetical protein